MLLSALLLPLVSASWFAADKPGRAGDATAPVQVAINDVPWSRREHWMRVANEATYTVPAQFAHPCPEHPFGTAIVNTTSDELVCVAVNSVGASGNPTLHGEIAAIKVCTRVLRDRGLSPAEITAAWRDFSLYTNGEPCIMCGASIRWAGFKELVYGTSAAKLAAFGFDTIPISGEDVWAATWTLPHGTRRIVDVLADETDPMFRYQYDESAPCPPGCARTKEDRRRLSRCTPEDNWQAKVPTAKGAAKDEL